MEIISVEFKGSKDPVFLLEPKINADRRGAFLETFNPQVCEILNVPVEQFIQDNMSISHFGVLRGLHYQHNPPMGKLVRVASGRGFDVVVDIRKDSPTYGQYAKFDLSWANNRMVWVPPGYAHGFLSLSNHTILCYKTTALYNKAGEGNINPLDKTLNIDWSIPTEDMILSEKDKNAQSFVGYAATEQIW